MPVAVAMGDALKAGFAPFGADNRIGISGQQRIDHGLQQTPHQVRGRIGEGFTENCRRVDNMWSGHRVDAFRVGCQRFLERSHGDRVHAIADAVGHHALHHHAGLHWNETQGRFNMHVSVGQSSRPRKP